MEKRYEEMTRRELWDAMQVAGEMNDGRSMRKIHKCLKNYNDGVPFMYRYPYFPLILSFVALTTAIIALVARLC